MTDRLVPSTIQLSSTETRAGRALILYWSSLVIIVFEDALLHPSLPLLVWLMLALSKGYTPGLPQLLAVLGITEDIARQPWRDPLASDGENNHEEAEGESDEGVQDQGVQDDDEEEEEEMARCWALVESIRVRQLFGGMTGDMAMLGRYETLWRRRFRRRHRRASSSSSSSKLTAAEPVHAPPTIADGHQAWVQFLLESYGYTTASAAAHQVDTSSGLSVLLPRLSGYGTATAAAPQKHTGALPAACSADAVTSVGVYVAELGRRCAAVIHASTAGPEGMTADNREEAAAMLQGLATWLAVRREDVPSSAIDFHCSNIIDSLLQRAGLRAAILAAHKASLRPSDWEAADSLDEISAGAKAAMWVCSSSINGKAIIALAESGGWATQQTVPWCGGYYDGDPVPPVQNQRVWAVMAEAAEVYQRGVIDSRVPHRPGRA